MLFSKRTVLVVAAVLSAQAQAQSAQEALQSCIVTCSATAATSVGCTGLTDYNCYCTKQAFVDQAAQCAAQCPNYVDAALQGAFGQFVETCSKNSSEPFSLTVPSGAAATSTATNATVGAATSTSAPVGAVAASTATATSAASDGASGLVVPGLAAFAAAAAAAVFAL